MHIITLSKYEEPAINRSNGNKSTQLSKVIKKLYKLPGEVVISPDGKNIINLDSNLFYKPK